MFDYSAGEKYKLTLIMVGLAGVMAGMFFTILVMPSPEPVSRKRAKITAATSDPDVTGRARMPMAGSEYSASPAAPQVLAVDPYQAKVLVDTWLPLAWDLSAGTAKASQERAISMMTPECAQAYRQSVWTHELAKQIEESGLASRFQPSRVDVGNVNADGTLVIKVAGTQELSVEGKVVRSRNVQVEYLMRNTPGGLKIGGISEVNG